MITPDDLTQSLEPALNDQALRIVTTLRINSEALVDVAILKVAPDALAVERYLAKLQLLRRIYGDVRDAWLRLRYGTLLQPHLARHLSDVDVSKLDEFEGLLFPHLATKWHSWQPLKPVEAVRVDDSEEQNAPANSFVNDITEMIVADLFQDGLALSRAEVQERIAGILKRRFSIPE